MKEVAGATALILDASGTVLNSMLRSEAPEHVHGVN